MEITQFPNYYRTYLWDKKHRMFGYAPDRYPEFQWIRSLERRFLDIRHQQMRDPCFLVEEMIQWGGNQHGILTKFRRELESYCLSDSLKVVVNRLDNAELAIESALDIPGLGLTYASKLLRFLAPDAYGSLDRRIRDGLGTLRPAPLPKIWDGNKASMTRGYVTFITYVRDLRDDLHARHILPSVDAGPSRWRVADVEMALFGWVSELRA